MRVLKPGREARHGISRLHTELVRTPERRAQAIGTQGRNPVSGFGRRHQTALGRGLGADEGLEHGFGLRPACRQHQAAVRHFDACPWRHFGPYVAAAACAPPGVAGPLARDGHEAEVEHRRTVGLGVAVEHAHRPTTLHGGERVRQSDDARPHDEHIAPSVHVFSVIGSSISRRM